MLTIGWFSTGRGEGSRQLLRAVYEKIQNGEIEAKIAFVFSNREPGEAEGSDLFFELVHSYNIPLVCLSYKKFAARQDEAAKTKDGALPQWRLEYDREIMRKLHDFTPDLCVLAGYMLIVGEEMCHRYDMINLHPAAPDGPKGTWQEVIWTLMSNQVKESGIMMHLATPELDRGPVITYCKFSLTGEPFDKHWLEIDKHPIAKIKEEQGESNTLFQLIRQHGLARELPLIVSTLIAFSHGEIIIKAGKLVDRHGKLINGYDLSDKINLMVEI